MVVVVEFKCRGALQAAMHCFTNCHLSHFTLFRNFSQPCFASVYLNTFRSLFFGNVKILAGKFINMNKILFSHVWKGRLLGTCSQLRIAFISFLMSFLLSVRMEKIGFHRTEFYDIYLYINGQLIALFIIFF